MDFSSFSSLTSLAWMRTGALVGLAVAAPVGPIGVLVIRRSLAEGRASGFFTGLGAAAADATYASIGALGTSFATHLLARSSPLRMIGGAFLVWLGVRAFVRPTTIHEARPPTRASHARAFASTLFLTFTNPATILSFAAVSAGVGLGEASARGDVVALVAGVFLGSCIWWLFLSSFVAFFRARVGPKTLLVIRFASGAILFGFGVVAWVAAVHAS